jgi:glycosyltransferase involved in cell wall biosynthesis
MTRIISIVTPAYKPVPEYLAAAYESLRAQVMPRGWDWQWVVQEDGETGDVARMLPHDDRISAGSGRRTGESATRTMCLSRAAGEFIKVLDADDQLTPGALARDIGILAEHPEIGWTTAAVLDLFPDGTTIGFNDPPEGPIGRGDVFRYWKANNYRAQVHSATLCIRKDLVLALGGWMALAGSGDTGLLLAANEVSAGYFISEVGMLYRKWAGQMTNQAGHTDAVEWPARMTIIEGRALAMRALWNSRPVQNMSEVDRA